MQKTRPTRVCTPSKRLTEENVNSFKLIHNHQKLCKNYDLRRKRRKLGEAAKELRVCSERNEALFKSNGLSPLDAKTFQIILLLDEDRSQWSQVAQQQLNGSAVVLDDFVINGGMKDISRQNTAIFSDDGNKQSELLLLWMHGMAMDSCRVKAVHETMLHLRDKHKAMTKVRRGETKSVIGGGDMYVCGLTAPRNQQSLQAGRYKLESEHEDKRSAVDEALASCADAVHAIVPQMVDQLSRTHPPCDVMRNSSGAPTSRGFTNCTLTTNYSCSYHIDREDHNCGAIMWFQESSDENDDEQCMRNGAFVIPSLGVFMRPRNGSFVYCNLSKEVHGTAAPDKDQPELHGVAVFCKPSVNNMACSVANAAVKCVAEEVPISERRLKIAKYRRRC